MSIEKDSILAAHNPLVEHRADPWILKEDETYFFTGSYPDFDRIVLRGSDTLAGLSNAPETVIWARPDSGEMGGNIWAPELHKIDDKWYFYFTAGHGDKPFRIRMYVIEGIGVDPRTATWGKPSKIETEWDEFSLDGTVFERGGDYYYVWSQRPIQVVGLPDSEVINSNIYLSKMADPFTLVGSPALLTSPEFDWENHGFRVNEGAAILKRNGRIFITYSASATDHNYCMGLLTADEDADLTSPASWIKKSDPVFVSSDLTGAFGPGHNSFTVDEEGRDVIVYHARSYRDIVGNSLFDFNRHARVQSFYFDEEGAPAFGLPVGDGAVPVQLVGENGLVLAVEFSAIAVAATGSAVRGESWSAEIPNPALTVTDMSKAATTQLGVTSTLFRVLGQAGSTFTLAPVVSPGREVVFDSVRFPELGSAISMR